MTILFAVDTLEYLRRGGRIGAAQAFLGSALKIKPILSIDSEIRFRSAAERAQFSSELTAAITQLAARYHDASAPGGRTHRLVLVAHPLPQENKEKAV